MNDAPRVRFCDLPTPVRPLHELSKQLWMKDDSHTAPLWGGNKPRKLEFVIGDALERGKKTILTFGALGTNHMLTGSPSRMPPRIGRSPAGRVDRSWPTIWSLSGPRVESSWETSAVDPAGMFCRTLPTSGRFWVGTILRS